MAAVSYRSKRNRRLVGRGERGRAAASSRGTRRAGALLPSLAAPPGFEPPDPGRLAAEVARLAGVGRRDGCI